MLKYPKQFWVGWYFFTQKLNVVKAVCNNTRANNIRYLKKDYYVYVTVILILFLYRRNIIDRIFKRLHVNNDLNIYRPSVKK